MCQRRRASPAPRQFTIWRKLTSRARQWDQARATTQELQRSFPTSAFTPRALVSVGQIADDAKNDADAAYFLRTAVSSYQDSVEVAQAQFNLAWMAHDARNFSESSKQLTEHLAYYADKNTDNRAAPATGRLAILTCRQLPKRARFTTHAGRYDANWYGYLLNSCLEHASQRRRNHSVENFYLRIRLVGRWRSPTCKRHSC